MSTDLPNGFMKYGYVNQPTPGYMEYILGILSTDLPQDILNIYAGDMTTDNRIY